MLLKFTDDLVSVLSLLNSKCFEAQETVGLTSPFVIEMRLSCSSSSMTVYTNLTTRLICTIAVDNEIFMSIEFV